ncbi:hypothetical protein LROSRS0_0922 [Furfurilactobacillus rossiae]|uniref:Glycosyltransferase RgtA/B/C/D-like domain-containing protein n=1 Tax=Furfurilactobacillus rossiae DSM 15814 TaxID=1114972 RepID=A0A0R1R8A4_9LACO|nr:DUF6020 family protein [Furfurilactobacillus rossiae]KRL52953.1 hypothetical protein FD35_GL001531 [Furfurilactobacillus rossiae DSM 15814]QFR67980.1 hypothetical protein LR814_13130 [Furfurilactobacillus rossiae]QLE60969.1 hypothetical protein LROSRS0_0922 [Furfurilactobacillus rossiae]
MQYKKINIHLFSLILLSVFVSWGICLHFDSLANNTSLDFFTRLNSLLPNNENTLLVALGSVGTFFLLKIAFQTTISLKFGLIDGTLAFFLSFFTVIGGFFQANPPSSNLSVSNLSILFGIVKIIALTTLLTSTFISITSSQIVRQFHHTVNKKRNPYFIISIIILLAWIPYMIILFPGTGSWDTVNQIAEFFGTHVHNAYPTSYYLLQSGMSTLSDHHPVFLTLFFGGAVKLGLALGNPLLGIFFLSLFQCLYAIGICVFSIHVFRRMGMTAHTEKVLIIFYAFSPVFPLYSLFVVKNTLYGITIFWFCLLLLQFVQNSDETSHSISWILQVIVNLLLQTITVKYGLIVASLTSIVLLLSFRKKFIRLFAILAIPLIIFHVGYSTTLKLLNVTPGDPVESYALPFQQTARFVKNHPNDVTKKEKRF